MYVLSKFFFRNLAFYEIMSKNILQLDRTQMSIWRMRNACWKTKATITHSEYIIRIAFPQQHRLYESASISHNTYIAVLLSFSHSRKMKYLQNF
jgi:hypothetical protein